MCYERRRPAKPAGLMKLTRLALTQPARRGACPGLLEPMLTGDGWLVRLPAGAALTPASFAALSRAAARHGNGLIEVTARGSLQVRGLTSASAQPFAEACRKAGMVEPGGPPVIASPLGRLEPGALADPRALAADLRAVAADFAGRVAAKVAIAVDDGGALHLDGLAADIRLRALGAGRWLLAIGGDGSRARRLGAVEGADAVTVVRALLDALAARGREARARDLADPAAVVARWLRPAAPVPVRPPAEFIGTHRLAGGRVAVGVGLAFGQAEAGALEALAQAAAEMGATGIAPAPERALLAIGLPDAALVDRAARLGFVTRADDPRRRVIACAGAPACGAGLMPARGIAAEIAAAAAPLIAAGGHVHLSGCGKGCASRAAASLTIVGTEAGVAIIRDGGIGDKPVAMVPVAGIAERIGRLAALEPA